VANPPTLAAAAIGSNNTSPANSHDNMQPFLAVNYIISLFGIFPSQN
jgi:microcystin-dependent protein